MRFIMHLFLLISLAFTTPANCANRDLLPNNTTPNLIALLKPKAQINYISDYHEDQQLYMNAQASIELSQDMLNAVHHEIALHFKTEIVLSEKSNFFGIQHFNAFKKITYETELRYDSYTKTYLLNNKRNQQNRSFKTLKEALYTLTVLYNFPVTELSRLHPSNAYQLKLRLSLMPERLPTPLILTGYLNDTWHLDSDWYQIEIHTPLSWY